MITRKPCLRCGKSAGMSYRGHAYCDIHYLREVEWDYCYGNDHAKSTVETAAFAFQFIALGMTLRDDNNRVSYGKRPLGRTTA